MGKRGFLACAVFLAASLAFGQDSGQGQTVPRRLLLSVSVEQGGEISANDALMISRSIEMRLGEATTEIVVLEPTQNSGLDTGTGMTAQAQKDGADCWASVTLGGGWNAMKLRVQSFDVAAGSTAADFSVERSGYTSVGDLSRETWDDIVQPISKRYRAVPIAAARASREVRLVQLLVTAAPGTTLTGLGDSPVTIGPGGSETLQVPTAKEYLVRATLPGHVPSTQRVFVAADRQLSFTLVPSPRWAIGAGLQDFGFPSLEIAWIPLPGVLFLKLGATTYVAGLVLTATEVLSSDPLTTVDAQAGVYLGPQDGMVRFYLGVGGFLRILHAPGASPGLDPLSVGGLQAAIGAEAAVAANGRLSLAYTPTLYATDAPGLFMAMLGPGDPPTGWLFAPTFAASLLSFRVGWRWLL